MQEDKVLEITRGQKIAANVIAGVYIVLCGLVLLLAGLGVFGKVSVGKLALPTVLATIGAVFLTTALIQRNSVSLWLSFVFITPAVVSYIAGFTVATYAQLYPLYVAIPAISSLFTMPMSGVNRDHARVIIFFGLISGILALNSTDLLGWNVVLPILLVFVGLCIVAAALSGRRKIEND